MTVHQTLTRMLAVVALAGASAPVLSASIDWSTGPTFNGPSGHLGILTNGSLVEAVNLKGVAGAAVVVDPTGLALSFDTVNSTSFASNWVSAGGGGAADAGWASILTSFEWQGGSNVTSPSFLSGLTVGHTYQVQFFAARSDCCGNRTATFGDGAGNLSAAVLHDSYTSIVGSFVADASSQTIQFIDSTANPILNAYVLRDLTAPVPEPGAWAMMALGLAVFAASSGRRRSRG
jgi:hypothetical protein